MIEHEISLGQTRDLYKFIEVAFFSVLGVY